MVKKKTKNNSELVQLALDSHKWINTPAVYTTYGSNFTKLQQDIMLQVSGCLQDELKRFFDDGRHHNPERPNPIFTSQELASGLSPVRIEFSTLGVSDNNYSDVDAALDAVRNLWVKAPVFDPDTGLRKGTDWRPVFKRVRIPTNELTAEGETYKYRKADSSQVAVRRESYIEVAINEEVAADVFDMSKGYFNHLERIAYFCRSAHSSRLYLLLMKDVSKGQMNPLVAYRELKEFLGMIERAPKSDEIVSEKYPKFSQFKKLVLDVAQRDLDQLASENKSEIVFTYEPVYKRMSKRGDPDAIKFHVKRSALGNAREQEVHRPAMEGKLIGYMCKLYPGLDRNSVKTVVSSVPQDIWTEFSEYVYKRLQDDVEAPHRWNDTVESYVMHLVNDWIASNFSNVESEEVIAEPDLFSSLDNQSSIVDSRPSEDALARFASMMSELMPIFPVTTQNWLSRMTLVAYEPATDTATISVSDSKEASYLSESVIGPNEGIVCKYFSAVNYRVG